MLSQLLMRTNYKWELEYIQIYPFKAARNKDVDDARLLGHHHHLAQGRVRGQGGGVSLHNPTCALHMTFHMSGHMTLHMTL